MTTISANSTIGIVLTTPAYANPVSIASGVTISTTSGGNPAIGGPSGNWTLSNSGIVAANTAAANGTGVSLAAGGRIVNQLSGSIAGYTGIFGGASLTVANYGTVFGRYAAGISFAGGGAVTNQASALVSGYAGVYSSTGALSVVNYGTIAGQSLGLQAAGLDIRATAQITNHSGATISGFNGIYNKGAATVVNYGSVSGSGSGHSAGIYLAGGGTVTNRTLASISGYSGIYERSGAAASVINYAAISASGGLLSAGIELAGGGTVSNRASGNVQASNVAISAQSVASIGNYGTIGGTSGDGIDLSAGGTVLNHGSIGGYDGIGGLGGQLTAANYGTVTGSGLNGDGILLLGGGTITNSASAVIQGTNGGIASYARSGVPSAGVTVVNAGTLSGGKFALLLTAGYADRLIDRPGAVFVGAINGGNTAGATAVSTLELATGAGIGTITSLGTTVTNFGSIQFDTGASWYVSGNTSSLGGTISGFAFGDTIQVTGITVTGSAYAGGVLTLMEATGSVTLDLPGSFVPGAFLVTNVAGGADVTARQNRTLNWNGAGTSVATAANWNDVTNNLTPAQTPPNPSDFLQFLNGGGPIGGTATVSAVTFDSNGAWQMGAGADLAAEGTVTVGASLGTSLLIDQGATLSGIGDAMIAASASGASVSVNGTGSDWQVGGTLTIGAAGSGALSINNGATVTAGALEAATSAAAVVNISVTNATFSVTGDATVADDGTGVLSVLSGATFSAANLTIGSQGDASGAVVVSGSGSVINIAGNLNVGTSLGTGDLTIGPGGVVNAKVVSLQGQVVLENGELDPTVNLINQGQTAGGSGTIAAGDIVDEGVIQAGGSKPSQKLLVVNGTVLGGGPWTINGTAQAQANGGVGVLQINAGGTLELNGAVLNAASTTFTDDVTPQSTYTVTNSVVDVNFADATGVLKLDQIAGFGGTITAFQKGDSFVITGGTLSGLGVSNGNTLTVSDTGHGGTDSLIFASSVSTGGFSIVNNNTIQVACFAEGTRIAVENGCVSVEELRAGDTVVTADGRIEPIVWIGQRTVDCARHPKPETVWPVLVSAGAFAENVPVRDLYLSPDHAIFVDDVLIPVKLLINGTTITQVERDRITYFHVELPDHAVILAEGLPVESYLDTGDRADFGDGGGVVRLFPDFGARMWEMAGCAPLVMTGPVVERVRRRLLARGARVPLHDQAWARR